MSKYDLSSIDTLPAAPTSAPSKYDLGGIDAMPAASGFDKTASLFAASIGNPSEEAQRRTISADIKRITGIFEPVPDIQEGIRRQRQLEADHITRASPRTSLFLSAPENAAVAIQDAKTLAQIEAIVGGDPLRSLEIAAKRGAMSTGALGAKVGFDFPAVATDIIGESLRGVGVSDEYNVFKAMSASARRQAVATRNAIEYFTPEARNIVERAAASAGESAGMSLQLAPLAAATPQGAGMAAAFGLTTFAESYTKAREQGKGPLQALQYAIPQGAFEGLFEMAPAAFLADAIKNAPGLKQFTLGLIGKEVPTELATTLSQNLNDWVTFNPGKSVADFIAEQPEAMAETAIATVMGAGIQAGLIHGAQRVTGQFQVMQEERRLKQQQDVMQKLFEQAKNIKSDPVTFQSFMAGTTDNATVFVNADDLQQVLAQNGMQIDVLPTAAEMLAQGPSVTGDVEIPVGELMTAFAGTPAQEQIVQHTRVRQDDLSQAQWDQMGDIGAFLKSQTKEVQERQKQNEQFQSELDEIEAGFTGQLPGVPNIATAGYGSRDQQMVGRMVRHFYAVAADRMGVSPKQVADLWSVKFPGAEQAEAAPALTQGFDHGNAMLNVGLDVGATDRAQKIDADFVKAEIEKLGVQVLSAEEVQGEYEYEGKPVKELTYVPHLSRPLTEAEVNSLAIATGQEAIGQYDNGTGNLWGPNAAAWGAFNPEFFKDQAGTKLSDAQKELAQSMSSRRPTTKKNPEDHLGEVPLVIDYNKIEEEKDVQNMALVAKYPGLRFKARKPAGRVEEFIQHVTDNLLWLHDQIPADIRQRSKLWYDGARAIVDRWTAKYDLSDMQLAAVLAIYSPQKDWFMNVSLAERTLDIVKDQQNTPWSDEMSEVADDVLGDEKFALAREAIRGKKLSELTDKLEQAMWVRVYDEAHNNRGHRLVTPEGGFVEFAKSVKGADKKTGWPGFVTIIKALYVIEDGSPKMIDTAIGGEHKVRSFYNNIFHPTSDLGFVTIDTHAVAAGLLRPLSSNSVEVTHNFGEAGTATSAATGMSGTYAYYQEAYRRAAEARGLLPREMQSITWEAVRELYTMRFKHDKAKMASVDKLWSEYEKGKRELDSVRTEILALAGGVEQPAWVGHDSGISPKGWASSYTGELLGDRVPGRTAGMEPGAGERAAAGAAGSELAQAVRNAGAVAGPVVGIHYSQQPRTSLASSAFGSGMLGAERERLAASKDPRIKQRVAFYVNTGSGITPESGVGPHPHVATLRNLYDADADALKIWRNSKGDMNAAESAVLDAGFDGYLTRNFGGTGAAVMLGSRSIPVDPVLDAKRDAAYDAIVAATDAGPFDGGCVVTAQAIQQQLGGRLVALTKSGVAQHAAVELDGVFYDFNGPATEAEILRRFSEAEHVEVDAIRPLKAVDLHEAPRDAKAAKAIAKLLPDMRQVGPYVTDVDAVAEQPPSPEIPKMKQAAMAILQNTKLPFGQQSVESWKRDLERTDPDTASLIDWAAIPPGDYYKDQIAARLWQNDTWYYSALSRAMENAPAKVFGSGKAVAQWLRANAGKLSVKKEEIEATGVMDWLETQPKVTKENVVDFLKKGGVQIQEVVLGKGVGGSVVEIGGGWEARAPGGARLGFAKTKEAAEAIVAEAVNTSEFEQWQLPGGEPGTYRELLITLPGATAEYEYRVYGAFPSGPFKTQDDAQAYIDRLTTLGKDEPGIIDSIKKFPFRVEKVQTAASRAGEFRSSHFPGTPNILAHVRANMRTDANGKRVLFIEEIQSDWAQKGRKEGFNVPVTAYQVFVDGVAAGAPYESKIDAYDHETRALKYNAPDKVEIREVQAYQNAQSAANKGLVPLAPFVTDTKAWTALALKRMIAYAVENGFDSVAWTTGEQQAARYDLSKQVDKVQIARNSDGTFDMTVSRGAESVFDEINISAERIADVVGKDLAEKASSIPKYGERTFSGLDLKVGGEGMKGYYDGIVPQVANDVLKKIGGEKVETVELTIPKGKPTQYADFAAWQAAPDVEQLPQPGFEITDKMREAVGSGLPLFARGEQQRRGSFNPLSFELRLTEHANRTTLIHELSHFFMAAYIEMAQQPNAPAELTEFVENLLGYLFKTVQGGEQVGGEGLGQKVGAGITPDDIKTNPSPERLVAMLRKSEGKSLRYVVDEAGDFHFWDAYKAVHQAGAEAAGVPYDYTRRGAVYATPEGLASFTWGFGLKTDDLRRYMAGDQILFTAAGHGPVTGAEMAKILDEESDTLLRDLLAQNGEPAQLGAIPAGRTNIERWNAMTLDQQRPYWEHFAEQWEQYAMTGKAPTKALQTAFSAFAKWMKSAYQSFKNFLLQNPQAKPLDPEITQYFDRMLATEAELEAAREERGYKALFKAAADAGMSPSQFADYMALDELQKTEANELLLSRSLRDMKWLSNAKSKAIKEIQAEADELRALVRAGVEEELADTPIRKAERWLRKGEMVQDGEQIKATAGFKLNAEIVKAMFPQGAVDSVDLAKLKQMMSSTGTQHPDDVAAIFGFRNGETMVRELLELQPFKDEAQQLTDLRMLEEHGDLATPEAIEKAADAAIHNAAHLKMVATEVWALNNRIGSVAALTKAAKEFAKNLIGNTTVKKLSPSSYANAATRAGKMASRAVAKKETDVAAREKRMEMINAAAAKEAYAAEAEVRAMMNRLRKISQYSDKHSSVTSREFSVVQAVRAILGEFEIGSKGEKAQTYVATVSEYDPMLGARLKEVIDTLTAVPKPWQELTVDELRELHAEIGGLWTVAREIRTVELAGEKMTLDEARQQLLDKLSENRKAGKDGKAFSLTDAEIRSQDFMSFVTRGVRPESWISMKDGNDQYGPWRRLIWNAIDRAQLGYNVDKADKLKQLKALLEIVAADMKDVQIDAPELGGTFGAGNTIGYSELLHAILHTGNESNKTKLLVGRGWGGIREDGTLDSTKWDAFMKRMWAEGKITKTHMDFVQGIWDLMESMKEGAQKAHRATTGRYFEEIQATEIVTPFGTYRGGYVPAIVDRRLVADADVRKALEESQQDVMQTFEKPAGGFTKSRVKNYNSKLELNIAALGRHIDQVMLFTHMSVPVRNVQRVLRGKELSQVLSEQDRSALTKVIMPWLHGAATQTVTERGSMSYENLEILTKARSRAGAALMFANISNSVQQLTGFFPALLKTKSKELLFAAAKGWYKPRELAAHVSELSPYMKQRLDNEVHAMAEEIDHILLNPTRFEKAQDWAIAHSYFLQMAVDSAMSPIIWQAKFNETVARGGSQQEAIDLADSAVRMTQGSNRAIDIAAMERGSPFYRLFMQFAGYFNTQINLVGEKIAAAKTLPSVPAKYGRIGMVLWLGWLAPAIASALVVQLFRGGVEDDDDDGEWLDDWLMATLIGAPFKYAAAAVPVFGQSIVAAANAFNDKPYDDRISMSPAVSILEGGYRGGKALVGAFEDPTKAGRAIRDIGTFMSLFTGVPITPATKAIGYATDVETGKVAPTSAVDYGRGIITGTASPESKR